MLDRLASIPFGAIVQIAALAAVFYYILLFFSGTRGAQILLGLALVIVVLIGLTQIFRLDALNWLLRQFTVYLALAILIIFQPEIRRALAELGRQPTFSASRENRDMVDRLVQAVTYLAEHRIGALVAVEREIGTRSVQETGTSIDAPLVPEVLASLFFPHTPLHDGGVILRDNRILSAGCVFPLSQKTELHKTLGMRHRAAVGLSEETDAVVVVVSEETGAISACYRGRLSRGMDEVRLRRFLSALLVKTKSKGRTWQVLRNRLAMPSDGSDSKPAPAEAGAEAPSLE